MLVARRLERLFLLLLPVLIVLAASAQTLPTTTISDTVYRGDGAPAGGTLLISWPEFTIAAGAVAAGNRSTTLGPGGALSVGLVPNANATPANTVYTVVYQLDDGTVKTEYWIVPTNSPTTVSAVRTTLGAGTSASQMATQQFVNAALAAKANDAAVVHLSGNETIAGAKQFTVAPVLPAPVNPGDASNKQYVDTSVQNVGSGSFVSKTGDTMTGPLTLSGDPSAPGQAATKRYADLGLAGKASLIAGLVPSGQLGTGTTNNTLCLHGDSTWGSCGSSSNAVSIQNVPVDTTAPTDNQVITYVASLGKYEPKPGGGVTAGMQAVKYATDFGWSQLPATDLSVAGAKTVNLPACPTGVTGTEPWYYVYISGTGTAEAVLVTGGTCAGNGQAGTLQFTTLNAHPAGYAIGSASGGLQEALIAARFNPTSPSGPSQSGKVIVPPGELQAYARISIRASNVTVDFSGSIVNCYMNDVCIFAGDPSNANAFLDITLVNPRGRPMVISGQSPFIEVNGQKTRLLNVAMRIPPTGGTFSSYVQVDNDQSFLLDGLDTALATGSSDYGVLCNASVCNPVIYAPGPFSTNAAVGWLKNLNISMQCAGNGIDWQSGNTVRISDSVIQGFAQYGVRAGIKRGGYGGFELDNVYEEVGSCTNPAGAIGEAGVIAQGATVKVEGAVLPVGSVPQFANTGSTDYRYYIVANSTTYGGSNPLYAGNALTNGSGSITVTTPDVAGASTFDLLRVTYVGTNSPREQAPYGTGNYAVARNVTRASVCANGVCTFTDTQAALQSYTVATPTYFPLLDFWPGNLILTTNRDSGGVLDAATAWVQSAPRDIVAVQGMIAPAVISTNCDALYGWTPLWLSCYTSMSPGVFYEQGAFLLAVKPNQDGGLRTNLKGRLNFPTLGSGPGHIITLSDSNFQKTIATANNRPSNDANDAFIGYDRGDGNPAHVGISLGAPVSLSNYIGNVGDGANWLERLTSGLKEFKTNVQLDNTLTVAGTAQASSLLTTGAGSWAVQGSYGALSPALAGKSAIGFGAGGKLQVSENGGSVVEVAKLDSGGNVSENANTATQLAQAPTQCNGSFATGVQANGNANCSIADAVELAETSQPSGIPNYGIFWFDSSCHCPKVISNNGQPVQLGLLNVFNADANTLEEYNSATPQTLNVYGTRTDASNYERLRLGYDTTDGYFLVGSDAAGTGTQRGLGFWLQGSKRWVIDTGFNLKPWSDNVKDVGTPTLRLKHLYTGTYVDTTGGAVATDIPNAGTTGTTLNKLAKVTGAPATATIASTSDTGGVIGVVVDGAGTTGSAQIARGGQASCVFDGATTAGDYVQISSTAAGDCHDAGASYPGSGQVLGRVLGTNASAGTYAILVAGAEVQAPSAGNVNTVFGRSGTITAQTGDYTAGQVTGAAPLASPALTGTPTAPTPSTADNSTKVATTAYVKAQKPEVDVADFYSGASDDFGASLATIRSNFGSGVTVNLNSITKSGKTIVYALTDPFDNASASFQMNLVGGCGLTIIMSATWHTPNAGALQIEGCGKNNATDGSDTSAGLGLVFAPCADSPGCGPNNYAQFPHDLTNPVAGTAVAVGPPGATPTIYATGTATSTNGSTAVTGSGTTWTSAMVGSWMIPTCTKVDAGTGCGTASPYTSGAINAVMQNTAAGNCVSYVKTVNSATSITLSKSINIASSQGGNCVLPLASGGGSGSGQPLNYILVEPNAEVMFWIGGEGSGINPWVSSFGTSLNQVNLDMEGLPSGIGFYTTNSQELFTIRQSAVSFNSQNQGSGAGFGGDPLAAAMCDAAYQATGLPKACVHANIEDFRVHKGTGTNNAGFGFVDQCYSQVDAATGFGLDTGVFSTIDGVSSAKLKDGVYVDGCGGGNYQIGAFENVGRSGVHLGENFATSVSVTGDVHMANSVSGASAVLLDTNAATGNLVERASSTVNGTKLINDVPNGKVITADGTNANCCTGYYFQPGMYQGGTGQWSVNSLRFDATTSGSASIGVAAAAGTPSEILLPTTDPTNGQVLKAGTPSGGKVQTSWGSSSWGSITGTLSSQTDLQNALNLLAPLASPTFTGTPTVPGYAKTGTLVTGNYTSATASGTIGDSTVVAGPYAIGWITELTGGNNGYLPSSSANKAMMWGVTLAYPLSTSQVTYDIGSNADNTTTNNYDLGLFNSGGTLVLNLNSGTLHGNSFAPATGAVTLSWAQGSKTLQPGNYYLMYYSSNITSTPPTLVSPSATAFTFYKGEAGGSGTCGTTQGSGGFAITPQSGGALPTSITAPANSYSWGACLPAIWIH